MTRPETLQPVTDEAIRLAKTLLRTERHGALGTLEPGSGAPQVSRVSLATDPTGAPLILISRLSAHFAALEADPRCSLLLGTPGKGDPLAHPRMTLAACAEMLDGDARQAARTRFLARHPKAALYADFTDFAFWRLTPQGASLNGGFARAFELTADHLATPAMPDLTALEPDAVVHMNEDHRDAIKLYAETLLGEPEGDWRIATLDPEGMDLIHGDRVARLSFDPPLRSADELRPRLVALGKRARA
ncbi:HugZ family protein [Pontivivens ytuae]|uniref:HugZ family protein n=1 Tax=Pontivivens ytuae TaxID=2789856 RepID=A0A7S9LSB2_9RHOB|nr:DUF2470 domain-containing protein [Pontivivens ytuae]QPH54328.1 HugZ family protein [Pontivivens ytuae]